MRRIMLLSAIFLTIMAGSVFPVSVLAQTPFIPTASTELSSGATISAVEQVPASQSSTLLPLAPRPATPTAPANPSLTTSCSPGSHPKGGPNTSSTGPPSGICPASPNPYDRFLDTSVPVVLTREQKGLLAFHNLKDTGNLLTITGIAALTIGTNAHTAYGPGWKGFGKNTGYGFLQDAAGEFFGTFLFPSVLHQDPHYYRMPHASIQRRTIHSFAATVVARNDNGGSMPNYANLLSYPICTELSNLYVPGVNDNGPSTVSRILRGYATVPVDNLITEFLPDVARHIHVRVIFVQRILNQTSSSGYSLP